MPIHLRVNQYKGVNAHLHSAYQVEGGWSGFHSKHISDLAEHIDSRLPAGYEVDIEQSLQIREYHPDSGERIRNPRPDISVYETRDYIVKGSGQYGSATLTQPITATLPTTEELHYSALRLYRVVDSDSRKAILHIELLSSSNKLGGSGEIQYVEKRFATLKSGLTLLEIDYLHASESPIRGIPRYPIDDDSFPYYIQISDPTPTFEAGIAATYGFQVDDPIPEITVPLMNDDTLTLDLNSVYQHTFQSLSAYSRRVDYEQLPVNFETYSTDDQERIQARMAFVQNENK